MQQIPTVFSSTLYCDSNDVERARLDAALETLEIARQFGIPLFLCDGGSTPRFLDRAQSLGFYVVHNKQDSLGAARRRALKVAFDRGDSIFLYMELEKVDLLRSLDEITAPILRGVSDLVIPTRRSLLSFPIVQQRTERSLNSFISHYTGVELDYAFGPRVFNRSVAQIFLEYQGEYGDKWEAHFVPVVRAIFGGCRVSAVDISFTSPPAQTVAEQASATMDQKRLVQLYTIACSVEREYAQHAARGRDEINYNRRSRSAA